MKRYIHSVIPSFLLAASVGQIYAFTNFSSEIAVCIGATQKAVQFAFSLGIFFLGMGAAFFGKIVEKNIKRSTYIGMGLFISGLALTGTGIELKSIWAIYAGYGLLLGLGTGVIYITPVKTMMLWFPKNKAIAAAVPIISFGLGSTFSTLLYKGFSIGGKTLHIGFSGFYSLCGVADGGIAKVFFVFSGFYLVPMLLASMMLKKPFADAPVKTKEQDGSMEFRYSALLKDRFFLQSWLFMFLNISAGLCLIPLAKQMMETPAVGYSASLITLVVGLCGILNGGGRFIFAWWSDRLKIRLNILIIISVISFSIIAVTYLSLPMLGIALLIINACYGAGFSVIPAILSDNFGMDNISKIHGAVLSAWGVAGLVGNQTALFVQNTFGGYNAVLVMLFAAYLINAANCVFLRLCGIKPQHIVYPSTPLNSIKDPEIHL